MSFLVEDSHQWLITRACGTCDICRKAFTMKMLNFWQKMDCPTVMLTRRPVAHGRRINVF